MENKLELSYKDKQALYKDILKSQKQILQNIMPSYYNNDINPTMLDNLYFNMRNNIINTLAQGGYIPSASIKSRIAQWEGSSLYKPAPDTGKINRSFEEERKDFVNSLPKNAINKLSQESLDALYSYSYNVGAGNFRKRVVPVLSKYLDGKASAEEVSRSMYATKDRQLRGLQKRRRFERNAFYKGETGKDLIGNALNDLTPLQQQNPSTFKTINRNNFNPQRINSSLENISETTQYLNPQTFIEAIQKQVREANYGEQSLQNVNSNDSYLNAIYNSSINEEKQNINKDIENNEITKYLSILDNLNNQDYLPNANIFAEGGNLYENKENNIPIEYDLSKTITVNPKQQAERLISLGKGVYRDKISNKLLYNYDEMPTATVVGHKKKKSINDNLQAAYAKGIPSGTMSADMETMNAVTGGVMNLLSPSQIIGAAIHSNKPQEYFINLMKGNNGIVTDKFAQEHPYWSMGANMLFDGVTLGAGFNGRSLAKSAWNSDLRYELDPRYMRVYHHSPKPFDINNFNVATKRDAGLHVSPYPDYDSNLGNIIYKGYAKKPSFEFFDRGSNGFQMFLPINTEEPIGLLKTNSPLTERYLKAAYSPKSIKKLKFTPLSNLHLQNIPNKYSKKYKVPKIGLYADNDVDAIDLIFPKENNTFKEYLRKITSAGIDKNENTYSKYPLSINEINNNNTWINQQISDFLSSHGYSVGEYPNSNPLEKFPQSFSIFDRNAAHNWKRIKKFGGHL